MNSDRATTYLGLASAVITAMIPMVPHQDSRIWLAVINAGVLAAWGFLTNKGVSA